MAALLNQIIDEGRKFAGAVELQTSDMSAQAPVGTTLAILERQLEDDVGCSGSHSLLDEARVQTLESNHP